MCRTHPAEGRLRGRRRIILALSLAAASCGVADARPQPEEAAAGPNRDSDSKRRAVENGPEKRDANPFAGLSPTPSGQEQLAGRIEERLVAGSYVYLAIRGRDGELRWAVVLGAAPPVDADVALVSTGRRTDFHSPRLGRDFAVLHFAVMAEAPVR